MKRRGSGNSVFAALVALTISLLLVGAARSASEEVAAKFRYLCQQLSMADAGNALAVSGRDGLLFSKAELRHLSVGKFWGADAAKVSRSRKAENADPLPAILDFKEQLDALGIELLLLPVPAKATIYPDKLSASETFFSKGGPVRLDAFHQEFYTLLEKEGVKVLDLTSRFLEERKAGREKLYCKQDTHWSGRACALAARAIAAKLEEGSLGAGIQLGGSSFESYTKKVEITGDLWSALGRADLPKERLELRFVTPARSGDAARGPAKTVSEESPVLLLGDSHTLVFHAGEDMHAQGAGLVDQLAKELGMPIDLLAVRGSGATPARISLYRKAKEAGYLKRKKLILWCFSSREFTEAKNGWRKVPVLKAGR